MLQYESRPNPAGAFAVVTFAISLVMLIVALVAYMVSEDWRWFVLPTASGLVLVVALVLMFQASTRTDVTEQEFKVIKEASAEMRRLIVRLQSEIKSLQNEIKSLRLENTQLKQQLTESRTGKTRVSCYLDDIGA